MRIAINGFGRIGRNFLRVLLQDPHALADLTIAAINIGPGKIERVPHLFKYDTLMGTFDQDVRLEGQELIIGDSIRIPLFACADAAELPWKQLSIDWVVDASGKYTRRDKAQQHLTAGARSILITAPADDDDITIIPGINNTEYDSKNHKIVSLGSCTTNAFMPILKIMHDEFKIKHGFMTTVHAYTNSQVLLDVEDSDLRLSRAAALNIIPSSTGAAKMIKKIIPDLANSITATSIRVPVAKVSLMDIVLYTTLNTSAEQINQLFEDESQKAMKGIVHVSYEPLVSSDYSGSSYSVVLDGLLTACQGPLCKIVGWYDNEWGYSQRLKDFLLQVAKLT
ncbi:glyceraldehyde-3-phosphate dehydrogenase [Candidatus Dependentiae bacterium Noda2021]|nr:glyceraldehyde-3-phosphate dehydrogenase [Candidatus Dependentiae bacterium Noda2021]